MVQLGGMRSIQLARGMPISRAMEHLFAFLQGFRVWQ